MKYEIEIPDEIDERLCRRAAATGQNVEEVIRTILIEGVEHDLIVMPPGSREPGPIFMTEETCVPFDLPRRGPFEKVTPIVLPPRSRRPTPYFDPE